VTAPLLATEVEDGILGSFAFDAQGDMTDAGVTVYRIERGRPSLVTAITPPTRLARP
jgi:hypothetical protein